MPGARGSERRPRHEALRLIRFTIVSSSAGSTGKRSTFVELSAQLANPAKLPPQAFEALMTRAQSLSLPLCAC